MNGRVWTTGVVVAVLVGLCVPAAAELTAGQKQAAEVLIGQFTAKEFATRQQAVEKLVALGPDVAALIRKTLAETTDNEVKLRCRMVLTALAEKYGIPADVPAAPPRKDAGFEASKVTIKRQNAALDEILQALSDQSGNHLIALPAEWDGRLLSFEVTDMPYWQALDKLCVEAKLTYAPDYREGGLQLVPARPGDQTEEISAYAGPVVVKLDSGMLRRTFGGGRTRMGQDGLTYTFSYYWEDRLTPISSEGIITKAVAPDGTALEMPQGPGGGGGVAVFGVSMARGSVSMGNINANFEKVPRRIDKLAEVTGTVTFTTGTGQKVIRIPDALTGNEASATEGDLTLTVSNVNRRGDSASLTLKQTVKGEEVPLPAYPASSPYGVKLVDPNGNEHKGTTYGMGRFFGRMGGNMMIGIGPDGGVRVGPGPDPGANPGVIVIREEAVGGQAAVGRDGGGNPGVVREQAVGGRAAGDPDAGGNPGGIRDQAGRGRGPGGRNGGRPADPRARGGRFGTGGLNVTFQNLPEIEGKWTLVVTMPETTTEKEFPFTFKDVPLP